MPIRNFFYRYNNAGKPTIPTDMSAKDKEHLAHVRSAIFNALEGDTPTKDEIRDTTAITDIPDIGSHGSFTQMASMFSQYIYTSERDKQGRLEVYREMSKYPEIAFAVDEYVDEAINENKDGEFIKLIIKNKGLDENENQRKTLLAEFDHIIYNVMQADKHVDRWFREYMIDAEVFFEKLIDNSDEKKGIIGVKKLMTTKTHAIFSDLESDDILFFAYQGENDSLLNLSSSQVAYANSGRYDWARDESMKIVLSFLEETKITYRHLKLLEDALVIYRIVRAPERRVFKIDVGNLPKGRADQFMEETIRRYRQRKFFNPATGEVDAGLDMMAMTEDFWFPVFQGGRSSDVSSLPGGQGLGEIGDLEWFRDKLYRGLKIPKSRYGEENRFSIGNNDDITREEMKFVKEVKRYTRRFSEVFKSVFMTHLKLKGIAEEYGVDEQDISVQLLSNNLFDRYMEARILELRFENFSHFSDLIDTEKPMFSAKWVAQKYLEITEEEWQENQELLVAEEGEGGGDEGGDDGGGDEGGEDLGF